MTNRRSRTGCATCRGRKLKCDEVKPVCGHCLKSNRQCVPSEGLTFRHEHNPTINMTVDERSLNHFYAYRETYSNGHLRAFLPTVPISGKLQWVLIDNPYDESQNPSNPSIPTTSYQQVASHSLEALSTAATDHPAYAPPNTFPDYEATHHFIGRSLRNAGYGPALHSGTNHANTDISFLLNPSSATPSNMIDPNLEEPSTSSIHDPSGNAAPDEVVVDDLVNQEDDHHRHHLQDHDHHRSHSHELDDSANAKDQYDKIQPEDQVALLLPGYGEGPDA